MRRRRGRGMERWMGERERDVFYITIAFLEDSFCRGKRRSENGEREREKEEKRREKKRKTEERKASGPDENREALFACFGVVIRRERDRTRLTSQQRLFFSFFFLVFLCVFSTFALCFLFYRRNDVNDDDDTDAENQFHPHFADKNNTVILYWSILRAS